MEHLQVWWGDVHIARGYLSLQRISPCHLFQYRLHVTLLFLSCEPGTNLRPPVLSNTHFSPYFCKRRGEQLRFESIYGNLGQDILQKANGRISFTDHFRVVNATQIKLLLASSTSA